MLPLRAMNRPVDLVTISTARTLLGVSTKKMAELLKQGTLRSFSDPLDRRAKLVSKEEALALKYGRAAA